MLVFTFKQHMDVAKIEVLWQHSSLTQTTVLRRSHFMMILQLRKSSLTILNYNKRQVND